MTSAQILNTSSSFDVNFGLCRPFRSQDGNRRSKRTCDWYYYFYVRACIVHFAELRPVYTSHRMRWKCRNGKCRTGIKRSACFKWALNNKWVTHKVQKWKEGVSSTQRDSVVIDWHNVVIRTPPHNSNSAIRKPYHTLPHCHSSQAIYASHRIVIIIIMVILLSYQTEI